MKDIILSILAIAFSLFTYIFSDSFSLQGRNAWNLALNPAVYPRLLAMVMFVLGLVHLVNTLRKGSIKGLKFEKLVMINVGKIVGLVLVYIVGVYYIGFIVATTIFLGVTIIVGGGNIRQALIVPLPTTLGLYLLFQVLFAVPLPMGEFLKLLR